MTKHCADYHPMTFEKACNALFLVKVKGLKQTTAANLLNVNGGSICHVVHGHRFPTAYPIPLEPEEEE